jgi:hypothetical protein
MRSKPNSVVADTDDPRPMSDLRSFDVSGFLQRLVDGKTVLKLAKNKIIYAQVILRSRSISSTRGG